MDAVKFIDILHKDNADGFIALLRFDEEQEKRKPKTYCYKYESIIGILGDLEGLPDVYITPNTYYIPKRENRTVRHYRALYIDLDVENYNKKYKTNYSIQEVYDRIFEIAEEGKMPKPSMIVHSGRGLHSYWIIRDAPKQFRDVWQEVEDRLYYILKDIGADKGATDGARVLRLPSTINTKNGEQCKILYVDETDTKYSLIQIRDTYFKRERNKSESVKKTEKRGLKTNLFNSYSLHIARREDIYTLCKLRNWNVTGYRNFLVLCFAYWEGIYTRIPEDLEKKVMDFNKRFTEPLPEGEVKSVLRAVDRATDKFIAYEQGIRAGEVKRVTKGMMDKGGYWFKNETLIERLDITPEEQTKLKTIIGKEEKYRRNNGKRRASRRNEDGLTAREQAKQDTINKVMKLKEQGMTQTQIAKTIGISQQQVSKIVKVKGKIKNTKY